MPWAGGNAVEGLGRGLADVWKHASEEADSRARLHGSPTQLSCCQRHASVCCEVEIITVLTYRALVGIK